MNRRKSQPFKEKIELECKHCHIKFKIPLSQKLDPDEEKEVEVECHKVVTLPNRKPFATAPENSPLISIH
jgi:hypothetical protein